MRPFLIRFVFIIGVITAAHLTPLKPPTNLQSFHSFCSHGPYKVITILPYPLQNAKVDESLCEEYGMDTVDLSTHSLTKLQESLQRCASMVKEAKVRSSQGMICIKNTGKIITIGPCQEKNSPTLCFARPQSFRKLNARKVSKKRNQPAKDNHGEKRCKTKGKDNGHLQLRQNSRTRQGDHTAIVKPNFEKPIRQRRRKTDRTNDGSHGKYEPARFKRPRKSTRVSSG